MGINQPQLVQDIPLKVYFLNVFFFFFFRKGHYCFSKGFISSRIPGDYYFNGRLDFQGYESRDGKCGSGPATPSLLDIKDTDKRFEKFGENIPSLKHEISPRNGGNPIRISKLPRGAPIFRGEKPLVSWRV